MFNVDKSHCVTIEQKILWNIWESLKQSEAPLVLPKQEEIKEVKKVVNDKKMYNCKYCGGNHENVGWIMACARKFNKERDKK